MGFLNDAGVTTLWSRIRSYMTGDHVKTSAVNNATNVDQALTALNTTDNAVESGLAVVANGDTHAAIASGQYVYVKNHSSLTEGLYKTTTAIDANGSLVNKVESASNVLSQQSQQIGNVALPTTAQTLTGAIAENNDQIKTFANKFNPIRGTVTAGPGISIDVQSCYKINNVAYISVYAKATTAISGTVNFLVLPWETKARNDFVLITPNDTIIRLYTSIASVNLNFNSVNIPANTDIILNVNYIIL